MRARNNNGLKRRIMTLWLHGLVQFISTVQALCAYNGPKYSGRMNVPGKEFLKINLKQFNGLVNHN